MTITYNETTCPLDIVDFQPILDLIQGDRSAFCQYLKGNYDYTDEKIAEVTSAMDALGSRVTTVEGQLADLVNSETLLSHINALKAALAPLDENNDGSYGDVLTKLTEIGETLNAIETKADQAVADAAEAKSVADSAKSDAQSAVTTAQGAVSTAQAATQAANDAAAKANVNEGEINALKGRVTDLANAQPQSVDLSDYNTKSEIDQKISDGVCSTLTAMRDSLNASLTSQIAAMGSFSCEIPQLAAPTGGYTPAGGDSGVAGDSL